MIRSAKFVLGLSDDYTREEILRAFRRLALIFHPDKNGNSEESKQKFHVIQQSKHVLLTHLDETQPSGNQSGSQGVASWVCDCRRVGFPLACARIPEDSKCICGHGLGNHREQSFECSSCRCDFFQLPMASMTQKCGHCARLLGARYLWRRILGAGSVRRKC